MGRGEGKGNSMKEKKGTERDVTTFTKGSRPKKEKKKKKRRKVKNLGRKKREEGKQDER